LNNLKDKSHIRHISKAVSWRLLGTIDTILISYWITGDPMLGLKIGFSEILTKMVLYYFHERIWFKIKIEKSRVRHFIKAFTWRFVGSVDTLLLAWFLSGNPLSGLKIGFTEVATKVVLYYLHERVWHMSRFGLEKKEKEKAEAALAASATIPLESHEGKYQGT
jgi:uncharacterized membrane protein